MNTSAKLALAAAVVGVAVVGISLLRAGGEVGQSSPPSSRALTASPTAGASSPAVVPLSSTASPAATPGGRIGASLITPPLPGVIGYTYFSIHDPVAPMVQPPNGDHLVGMVDGVISVVDIDGMTVEGFVPPPLTEFEPYFIDRLAWSRDGSMISFLAYSDARFVPFEGFGLFVMNADGSDLRLERHGTRPFFVDIETGHVTELPWETNSALSWQRVPSK